MPMIIFNMGAEMMFVLNQRLVAQKIEEKKQRKVLRDVISTAFNETFVAEVLKPQEIYSDVQVLKVFHRLAHSSIMKLNEKSMGKLYDLMFMGFKYQFVSCEHPKALLEVTHRHFDAVKGLIHDSSVHESVENARKATRDLYGRLSGADFQDLKETLALFFEHRIIRVSIFLKKKYQNNDGTFRIRMDGPLPPTCEMPGIIRYFSRSGKRRIESCFVASKGVISTDDSIPQWRRELGTDMYELQEDDDEEVALDSVNFGAAATQASDADDGSNDAAKATLKLLTSLIDRRDSDRVPPVKIDFTAGISFGIPGEEDPFRKAAREEETKRIGGNRSKGRRGFEAERISAEDSSDAYRRKMRALKDDWDEDTTATSSKKSATVTSPGKYNDDDDDDDLLSLMDDASSK